MTEKPIIQILISTVAGAFIAGLLYVLFHGSMPLEGLWVAAAIAGGIAFVITTLAVFVKSWPVFVVLAVIALLVAGGVFDDDYLPALIFILIPILIQIPYFLGAESLIATRFVLFPGEREWVAEFYDYLGRALGGGVDVSKAISARASSESPRWMRRRLSKISRSLEEGRTLSEAMSFYPVTFPEYERAVVTAGEKSGTLAESLLFLSSSTRVTAYKAFPFALALVELITIPLVVGFVMIFIIPKFKEIYNQLGGELPRVTQFVIDLTWMFMHSGLLLMGLLVAALVLIMVNREGQLSATLSKAFPRFGELYWAMPISRFAFVLGITTRAGVELTEAVRIAAFAAKNRVFKRDRPKFLKKIEEGGSVDDALGAVPGLPRRYRWAIGNALRTNNPEESLIAFSTRQRAEYQARVAGIGAALVPLFVLFVSSIVFLFAISIYLPIFNISMMVGRE